MKEIERILVFLVIILNTVTVTAQQYRVIPFAGYSLQESFDFAGKNSVIDPAVHYGIMFEYRIKSNYSIEMMYQRQETNTEISDATSRKLINTLVSWYLAGGVHYYQFGRSRFSSVAGLYVGVGNISNQDNNNNAARFASGIKAGVLCEITKSIGIRLQSQALLMLGGPGSVWGYDNVGTYGTIVQAGFSGGIVFSFGKKHITKPGEDS